MNMGFKSWKLRMIVNGIHVYEGFKKKIEYCKTNWSDICEMWDDIFLKCYCIIENNISHDICENVKCEMFVKNNLWKGPLKKIMDGQAIVQCVVFVA
jgi:hypothetical protein